MFLSHNQKKISTPWKDARTQPSVPDKVWYMATTHKLHPWKSNRHSVNKVLHRSAALDTRQQSTDFFETNIKLQLAHELHLLTYLSLDRFGLVITQDGRI